MSNFIQAQKQWEKSPVAPPGMQGKSSLCLAMAVTRQNHSALASHVLWYIKKTLTYSKHNLPNSEQSAPFLALRTLVELPSLVVSQLTQASLQQHMRTACTHRAQASQCF